MKTLSLKLSIPLVMLLSTSYIQAQTIKEIVEHTMTNNPKIMSSLKNDNAYRLYVDEAQSGYLPKLDLTAYIAAKKTILDPDAQPSAETDTQGYNVQLDFEQMIFDGGLTKGYIDEAQYRYNSNKYLNESIVDDIIFDSVDSYLNLVKYKNRLNIGEESISIYNDYYQLAKETEEISGEALHKSQVNAKIHYANNKIYEDTNNHLRATSSFKKNVGLEADGKSCRPNLDETKLPQTLSGLLSNVLVSNPLILEQVENIKERRAILNQRDAKFYPTISFKAQGIYDTDLITKREDTQIYSARVELSYNLFNGKKDEVVSKREKIFLEESQKTLDTVTQEVIDETTAAYNTYMFSKKREIELKKYIQDNKEILGFYKDQFDGGTRTFIDVLNIERDLISAKEDLIDIQYDLDSAYFEIFKNTGSIKEAILSSNNDVCTEKKVMFEEKEEAVSEDLKDILSDDVKKNSPEAMKNGTYAVYFVAYKNVEKTQKAISNMKELIGSEYKMKVEPTRGFHSAVVYNIETRTVAKEVRTKLATVYSDAYIRRVK